MQTKIETSRLVLRPFQPSDVGAAFTWFGDPMVMRFTVTGPDKAIEDPVRSLLWHLLILDRPQEHVPRRDMPSAAGRPPLNIVRSLHCGFFQSALPFTRRP